MVRARTTRQMYPVLVEIRLCSCLRAPPETGREAALASQCPKLESDDAVTFRQFRGGNDDRAECGRSPVELGSLGTAR